MTADRQSAETAMSPIVLFDIDGVILSADGTPLPGAGWLVDTLMCLGFEVRFWSAGGTRHAGEAINRAGIYGSFTIHEKPTYPPTEDDALRIVGRRPALQIDDDHTERIADWPFMEWGAQWGPMAAAARAARPAAEPGLREALRELLDATTDIRRITPVRSGHMEIEERWAEAIVTARAALAAGETP